MLFALSAYLLSASHLPPNDGSALAKKPLDHSVYDGWKSIRGAQLSADGAWFVYGVYPQEGDGMLYAVSTAAPKNAAFTIERGTTAHFTRDSRFLIVTQSPIFAEAKKARIAKAKPEDQPKSSLIIVDLSTGQQFTKEKVSAVRYAEEDHDWVAYKRDLPPAKTTKGGLTNPPAVTPAKAEIPLESDRLESGESMDDQDQRRNRGGAAATPAADGSTENTVKQGDTWILRNLVTGKEETIVDISDLAFSKHGSELAYAIASKEAAKDGVVVRDLQTGKTQTVIAGEGHYKSLALTEDGKLVAFLTDKDHFKDQPPILTLYSSVTNEPKAILRAKLGDTGLPHDWAPADAPLSFSEDGRRLFFHDATKPEVEKKNEIPEEDRAVLDIWNWKDDRLQTEQLIALASEKSRSYLAYSDLRSGKIVQLGSNLFPDLEVPDKGRADFAIATSQVPYYREASWDPGFGDLFRVDVRDGTAKKVVTHRKFDLSTSPDGRYALAYDLASKHLTSYDIRSGKSIPILLPKVSFVDELDDHPDVASMYGMAGFTTDGRALLYDRYDIWAVDPSGAKPAENITNGTGRRRHLELRSQSVNRDPETQLVDLSKPLLLSARNDDYETTGLFELSGSHLRELIYGEHGYSGVVKAKDAGTLAYTESTFNEYPDYWLTDVTFSKAPVKVSDANPQQAEYLWGSVQLVNWTGNDGQALKGLLYTPEGLDRTKKYPMITYFYERNSETLYNYLAPVPSASIINIPYFVSNGYCVFVPDIDYKIGYPGPSAYSAIVSGVQAMLTKGFIDPKRLGIQGQSWGGYQTAYLVTQTGMFAAAGAGAPVGDMFSAYGGIRYGAGIVRQFQYEHSQSRIGGTPWQKPLQYLENSPVFMADRVTTPILIMSNDKDGAVPHTQGIEFFVDLRRLNKPSWLLVYNDEDHNLTMRKNRKDLSIRLAQFFDHYLKGTPMPVWMSRGVPAIQKGKTYGFDLDK